MDNKQKAEAKIRELCPELQELSVGCNTTRGTIFATFESEGRYSYAFGPFSTRWDGTRGDATCPRYARKDFEIIGHKIHFEHTLYAISKVHSGIVVGIFIEVVKVYAPPLPFDDQQPAFYDAVCKALKLTITNKPQ